MLKRCCDEAVIRDVWIRNLDVLDLVVVFLLDYRVSFPAMCLFGLDYGRHGVYFTSRTKSVDNRGWLVYRAVETSADKGSPGMVENSSTSENWSNVLEGKTNCLLILNAQTPTCSSRFHTEIVHTNNNKLKLVVSLTF